MISRRTFLARGSTALAAAALVLPSRAENTTEGLVFSGVGISAPMAKAKFLKECGISFLTEGVGSLLVPDQPEAVFEKNLELLRQCPLPVLACGGFIRPPELRCVGVEANHQDIAKWADIAFRRLKKAGGKIMVFGSGSSRELRDGWPREKADVQFVDLLKLLGPMAEQSGITIAVELLRDGECNYINHIAEAAKLIRAAAHPNVRVLADLYHMRVMEDTPADLKAAMDVVHHVEIAEKGGRTLPGVEGDDFKPFFSILKESRYLGAISMEGKATDPAIAPAVREIQKQAAEV